MGRPLQDRREDSGRDRRPHRRGAELSGRLLERAAAVVRHDRHGLAYADGTLRGGCRAVRGDVDGAHAGAARGQGYGDGHVVQPHLLGRLCRGILRLQVGRGAGCRCLLALQGEGDLQSGGGHVVPREHPREGRYGASDGALRALPGPQARQPGADRAHGARKIGFAGREFPACKVKYL